MEAVRNSYGEIVKGECLKAAQQLLELAGKKIPSSYDFMEWGTSGKEKGKRIGGARHHEIYDVNTSGTQALVCVREVEGTKYGIKTCSKSYYVITRHGAGVRVIVANKAVCAKAAKVALNLGDAIAVALGKAHLKIKAAEIRQGYKLLVRTVTGYSSAWDGSAWEIGKTRIEAATNDHSGGFYYYATLDECLAAAAANEVFGQHHGCNRLAVVEVEASGKHYAHHGKYGTKLCASRVRPVREVAYTL